MNSLLDQFLSEAREALQSIGELLLNLEQDPENGELMTELFRYVHTLKGNSGLFDFPELTRVLHAGEDLLDGVQSGTVVFSRHIADLLLDVMDFVGMLCDEIEKGGEIDSTHAGDSVRLTKALKENMERSSSPQAAEVAETSETPLAEERVSVEPAPLPHIPEQVRMDAYRAAVAGAELQLLTYSPVEECFFQGDDPFYQARRTPGILWGSISARRPWPLLSQLDPYCCVLDFHILSTAPLRELTEHYRYASEQVLITSITPRSLILPEGEPNGGPVYDDFIDDVLVLLRNDNISGVIRSVRSMLELSNPDLWLASALRWLLLAAEVEPGDSAVMTQIITSLRTLTPPQWQAAEPERRPAADAPLLAEAAPCDPDNDAAEILAVQREILSLPDDVPWLGGRIKGVAATLQVCLGWSAPPGLAESTETAVGALSSAPLLAWLDKLLCSGAEETPPHTAVHEPAAVPPPAEELELPPQSEPEVEVKFGRRSEDPAINMKSIKVDQARIDRLMNLIGEMVVAKNALPYLAGRAESLFGVRELAREIKAQYSVINRIAEELQDSIMQVRMMPMSFVFQRFPRLVRDTSNKLGKKVNLILEGEETEADKNIIEALCDPLMHIVRNSLDHGIEPPDLRLAAGKPATGTLLIRAVQESDRVVIEVRDDGKGIDPEFIKRKAFEKGLLEKEHLERMTDQEAVNLVFLPGFSTVEAVSDLSGRGVGMDVVRSVIEKVNGTVQLESEKGKGSRIRISLPLSMAITNVMIVESDGRMFGVPMEAVRETVRIPRSAVKNIKKNMAAVLRGRIVPLKALNPLLGLDSPQRTNDQDEFAVLVVGVGNEAVGLLVDEFHQTVDIILKPMTGILSGITAYAGSALLGDGSVLMILNIREVV